MNPIRTVADLIAELQKLDPALAVGCLEYAPEAVVVAPLCVSVETRRRECPEQADEFVATLPDGSRVNVPHWFQLGSRSALYHEERGGKLEKVAVVRSGV